MEHVKAQVSVEFVIIVSALLIIIVGLIATNMQILTSHENEVKVIKAQDTLDTIYRSALHVYQQGENSKDKIFVMIPNSVNSISLKQGLIQINLSVDGNEISLFRTNRFNITGDIPTDEGYYWLTVISKGSYVEVKE